MNIDRDAKIAQRAYELWESEGKPDGRSLDHWRRAEAEFGGTESRSELVAPAVAKQVEVVKHTFETALAHARELTKIVEKSNREVFDVIRRRAAETLDELSKSLLPKKPD